MNFRSFAVFAGVAFAAGITLAALPQKINLRERNNLFAELADKEKNADKPIQRAVAGYDRRRLEVLLCEDKELPAKEKALEDFIQNPGLEPGSYISFLLDNVVNDYPLRRGEFLQMADKAAMASTNKADHAAFYSSAIRKIAPGAWSWGQVEVPELSNEACMKYIERAERDPLVEDKESVTVWKIDCLIRFCRYDEAEKLIQKMIDTASEKSKPTWVERMAKFYDERAYRFYSTPNPELKRKSINMWEYRSSLLKNNDSRARMALIPLYLELGEWQKAKSWIDVDVSFQKDQKPSESDILWYGDVAFGEQNWAEASKWYAQYPENKGDWQRLHKMAKAHHAAGDDALALGCLTNALKKCNNRYEKPRLEFEVGLIGNGK